MDKPIDMIHMYFKYHPNKPTAYVALAVFALIDIHLVYRLRSQKAPSFMYKLIALATIELLGFVLRIVCFSTAINLGKFLVMTLFMVVGPNIVAIVNYNSVAYMIRLSNFKKDKAHLKPRALKIISIAYTFIPSVIQGIGGGIQTVIKIHQTGVNIAIAGLSIQLCFFLLFYVCLVYVGRNSLIQYTVEGVENPKKKALIRIWATVTLLFIRVVYRLVQFSMGPTKYATTHEWTLYVFDVIIVAIVFLIFSTYNSCFPKQGEEIFGGKDEEKCKKSAEDDNTSKIAE
ncbi:hypothetical protein MFLAVUS_005935 [Mucor flavus]|uniref:Uncharacterized protein n=1 Tax=Mucor flavus TaxID=439312 RepID=A0ABP9Z049_9FUNG